MSDMTSMRTTSCCLKTIIRTPVYHTRISVLTCNNHLYDTGRLPLGAACNALVHSLRAAVDTVDL